jgi:hypothetical protein
MSLTSAGGWEREKKNRAIKNGEGNKKRKMKKRRKELYTHHHFAVGRQASP